MTRQVTYYPIQGGEDLLTPPLSVKPGRLIFSKNYECDQQGRARRIDGFERYDGRPAPSAASYWVIRFDAGTGAISAGDTVTGGTSGATAVALYAATVESGSYAGSDAGGYLVITGLVGDIADNEALRVGGVSMATTSGLAVNRGADNDTDDATWLQAAIEAARSDIDAVDGSGPIRGVWIYNGKRYAFRDNAGGTACIMWVGSTSGWSEVPMSRRLNFTSGGTTELAEGHVITGATSGATATVSRVVVKSGTWSAGTASGYVIFASQTGTFQSENLNITGSANIATIAGNSAPISLIPGGRYEFDNYNFFGQVDTYRMYGCDGVNSAFEFDGAIFCPLETNTSTDTPSHIKAHNKHLFLIYQGGSVKHSGVGYPTKWDAISGAAEIAIGDACVGAEGQPGGVLALWGRNSTHLLYGNDATDWEKKTHSRDQGAIEWTIQQMQQAIFLDDRGVTSLTAVQEFGDFSGRALSQAISPVINTKKSMVLSSLKVRSKDQYRLFFTDGTGINFTFSGADLLGITRLDYGMPVRCACTGEIDGEEMLMFGSDDGFVYHLDKGYSFDGESIDAMIRLPFNHLKSPENFKRFFKAVLEIDAPSQCALQWVEDYDYGAEGGRSIDLAATSGGGFWNINDWNDFLWSTASVGSAEAYLEGSGKNIGIFIGSQSSTERPHTLQGVILHYALRGIAR